MRNSHPPRHYVIVGSGVAGIAAAQSIRAADAQGEITLISDDPFGYYSRPGLAYYLSGEVGENVLYPLQKKDFQSLHLNWLSKKAVSISADQHVIHFADHSQVRYDRLMLATGSLAAPIRIPGANFQGVVKLDSMEDTRVILKACRRARTAVVVGGGITALELVEGLHMRGLQVHFLLRGDRYWSNVLDSDESTIVESRLQHKGVQIHYRTELSEIEGFKDRVLAVRTKDGKRIPCELVAVAIGVQPRLELAKTAAIATERGILANEFLQTSQPDIFAAGDVAQVFDPFSGQSALDTLWSIARQQGHAAGVNMAGQTARYWKSVPFNITRLAGLTTTIIGSVGKGTDASLPGINRGDSETWRMLPVHSVAETHSDGNRLRLLVGEKRLLGAVVMGNQSLSISLQEMISRQADITPIRKPLLHTSRIAETVTVFWERWRMEHAVTQS